MTPSVRQAVLCSGRWSPSEGRTSRTRRGKPVLFPGGVFPTLPSTDSSGCVYNVRRDATGMLQVIHTYDCNTFQRLIDISSSAFGECVGY